MYYSHSIDSLLNYIFFFIARKKYDGTRNEVDQRQSNTTNQSSNQKKASDSIFTLACERCKMKSSVR